jgi:hypothetical protein
VKVRTISYTTIYSGLNSPEVEAARLEATRRYKMVLFILFLLLYVVGFDWFVFSFYEHIMHLPLSGSRAIPSARIN